MLPVDKTSTASTDCLWGPRLTALLRRGSSTTWISWYKCVKVGSKAGRSSSRGLPGDQNGQRTRTGSRGDFSTRTMITTVCSLINLAKSRSGLTFCVHTPSKCCCTCRLTYFPPLILSSISPKILHPLSHQGHRFAATTRPHLSWGRWSFPLTSTPWLGC